MKVPGRKKSITSVMIFIETVSVFVFRASSPISWVRCSMFLFDFRDWSAKYLLASIV